ncbi:MAG: cyclic nucleotide-binding domain-containing protein, partial [Actinomycetota bacterium]|nr:cyclic nucleotide-binding domain-containing protein [Actinomycetota bacterium]
MTDSHALKDLLGELPTSLEAWLIDCLQPVELRAGERLFHEGDEGGSLYLVAEGRLQATRIDPQGSSQVIGELGRAEALGEMALLTDESLSATIHAIRDTKLLRLSAEHFVELISENPQVLRPISEQLIRRLRTSPSALSSPANTVALVPLGSADETADLATELAATATARGMSVAVARSYDADTERSNDLLIMQPPADIEAIEHCAANADRVLFVASGPHIQQSLIDEVSLRCPLTRRDLVVLHPDGRRAPRGTNRISERVRPHRIHHVRLTDGYRVDGLLRSILEQEIVLVLSGGG